MASHSSVNTNEPLIYNPAVPYVAPIPGGGLQPGKSVVNVKGMVLATGGGNNQIVVNLSRGLLVDGETLDDVALHFNPRLKENVIVLNSFINNRWGPEERHPCPLQKGQPFDLRIFVQTDAYKIALNGKPFADYKHRMSLHEVRTLFVKGALQLDLIHFEVPPTQQNYGSPTAPPVAPIIKPPVPFVAPIIAGFSPGRQIFFTGTPLADPYRFHVNLRAGERIALHFDVRFKEKQCIRNTFRDRRWDANEERHTTTAFPFVASATFDIIFMCAVDGIKVAVNGQHYVLYQHRVPHDAIDSVEIEGDLRIQQIHII